MRVLIAEDDPISRRVLQSALIKWGYEVEIARDGEEAWAALRAADAPRMAVLDWMMPGKDGLQICQDLRQRPDAPYVYAILLTAKGQQDDILLGLDSGADDYVVKPFNPNELRLRLRAGKRVLDLQAQLIAAKESVRLHAVRDPLTGLPNRLLFADRLAGAIASYARTQKPVAVMFLDLDHFKAINDSLGHNTGDELLKQVAQRLTGAVRADDTVARMGGDEFTFVLHEVQDAADAAKTAERVLSTIAQPFELAGRNYNVSGSIGISLYPQDGEDVETLVRNADAAMYRAKQHGRNTFHMFTDELNAEAIARVAIERSLREAAERNEFVLHYQLRVDLRNGTTPGMEALLRWQHPEKGLLYPASFIHVAEDADLVGVLTSWTLQTACEQNRQWQRNGFRSMDVGVNVSPRLLHRADLVSSVERALSISGLEPENLNLEVTEAAFIPNPEHAIVVMDELKRMGVRVSLDDFGSGYSSLSYLKRLTIDALKIDPSFVRHITTNRDDESISSAIIAMAHGMGMRVIAEGVETNEQLEALRQLGCDEVQGYFISRPVPAEEVTHVLSEGAPPLANWTSLAA